MSESEPVDLQDSISEPSDDLKDSRSPPERPRHHKVPEPQADSQDEEDEELVRQIENNLALDPFDVEARVGEFSDSSDTEQLPPPTPPRSRTVSDPTKTPVRVPSRRTSNAPGLLAPPAASDDRVADAARNGVVGVGASPGAGPASNSGGGGGKAEGSDDGLAQPPRRRFMDEDPSNPAWMRHKKHIFVLSSAGKPIYSRYGDEQNLAPFMASLIAMISFVQDTGDNLRYLTAGEHRFVFCVKGPIILVAIARTHEPVSQLTQQLNYVHSQIVSILTGGVTQVFEKRRGFDLRNLLGGADRFMDNLMHLMDHDACFFLNAIHCLRIPLSIRNQVATIIQSAENPDLLYGIMIAGHQLVSLIRPRKYVIQPADLHLIVNFVNASTAFRNSDSWTPICLPKFNDSGYLHAYISYIYADICLLMISTKQDAFYTLKGCKEQIVQKLSGTNCLEIVQEAVKVKYYSVAEIGAHGLLHFVYKAKSVTQITSPRYEAPYLDRHERKRLFRLYQNVHKRVHKFKKPHKVYYQVSKHETIVGWVTSGFELYAAFGPLESKQVCIKACNEILRWIKNEEGSLFILNSPIW